MNFWQATYSRKSFPRNWQTFRFWQIHLAWLRVWKSGDPQMTYVAPVDPNVVLGVSKTYIQVSLLMSRGITTILV